MLSLGSFAGLDIWWCGASDSLPREIHVGAVGPVC
jgi:hypothetical protein